MSDPPIFTPPKPGGDRPEAEPAKRPPASAPAKPASVGSDHQAPTAPNFAANPVEGEKTVTLTIDGEATVVRAGTNVLEAAKLAGKDICHFCYHPGLTIAASCRQCLVEIEKAPKLMPSCQQPVQDGMVVHTESPKVLEARRAMLEFTLVNHPIDCPICDKAGECQLQRHYMDHDHQLTRVDVPKIRKPKVKDIGEHIILDAERCILCSRCVRFCEEIPGTAELGMTLRGDHEEIDVAESARLDNPYSLNVVDICPVGALTSKDFRFQVRAWELRSADTTCSGCATGCAVELHHRHEQAYRVNPRYDPAVNGHWMCDEGRFTYHELDPAARQLTAEVDGERFEIDEAIAEAARRLSGKKTALVFSATATNEANLALAVLAQELDATHFVLARGDGEGDGILRDADKNPNTLGAHRAAGEGAKHEAELALELAGRAYEAVLFLDGTGELSDVALSAIEGMTSICLADRRTPIVEACSVVLPAASWAEILGTYTNRQGLLRVVRPAWRPQGQRRHRANLVRELLAAMGTRDALASARELTLQLAEQTGDAALADELSDHEPKRPTLLRWANTRG